QCGGIRLSPFTRIFRYFTDSKAKEQTVGDDFVPSMQKRAIPGEPPYRTPEAYAETLNQLKRLAASRKPAIPLHMVIDQENDTSKDLSRGGVIQFPSNMGLVAGGDPGLAREVARCVAIQMKATGMDVLHSPVVDVNINPDNPEIGRRAFSDDPEVVAAYAIAMLEGFKDGGVLAAAKHFPGRGDSATDAHHACPVLNVDKARLHAVELLPYKRLIEAGLEAVMIAHCIYPAINPENISTVSRKVVTGLLRDELGFKGLITSDSITMGALIDRYGIGEACARALAAGIDTVLMKAENHWRGEMFYTIKKWVQDGRIDSAELDDKVRRVLAMKLKYGLFDRMGIVDAARAARPYRDPVIVETSKRVAQNAILVTRDKLNALPLDRSRKTLLINQLNSIKCPNDSFDHPGLFQEIMEADWPELQTYETTFGSTKEQDKAVMDFVEQNEFDLILCTNYYDRQEKPNTYAKQLIDAGKPIVLLTNTPYCIKENGGCIPGAQTVIVNMNLTPEGLRTAKAVLFGELEPKGRWPLSNYDPFGLKQ
ncbi:MAG TPA: glycoside hydrolase family 3 N-terminal domain-containing protein, partial [Oceanipulchritudo sp.]|nr:glycoside hydrolase family 3 N-terminal domain-containing protein [Oceanipulchritudo sp.]